MTAREALLYLESFKDLDEPVFILRGQDKLALRTMVEWLVLAEDAAVDEDKIRGAALSAAAMILWPIKKLPD